MPTLAPGWNSVPRCRMMMLPGMHFCPPNSFTPRYLGCESLVFCVDPPCFLDAKRSCCHWAPAAAAAADDAAPLPLELHSAAAAPATTAQWAQGAPSQPGTRSSKRGAAQQREGQCRAAAHLQRRVLLLAETLHSSSPLVATPQLASA